MTLKCLRLLPITNHSASCWPSQHRLSLHQVDVVGAYLNGTIEENIYMKQPDGFVVENQQHAVCRLNKASYGLKQAGMMWTHELDSFLVQTLKRQRTRSVHLPSGTGIDHHFIGRAHR